MKVHVVIPRLAILSLLLVAVTGLSSCGTMERRAVSKNDIETKTNQLIARREHWTGSPYVLARQDESDGTWRVLVHALDSRRAECGCVLFIPGTGREILFSRSGRLISYVALR